LGGWRRWWIEDQFSALNQSPVMDATDKVVACFASDVQGNYFLNVDQIQRAVETQQSVNNECIASDINCTQDLGCALVENH
jgi:hypothetical protein